MMICLHFRFHLLLPVCLDPFVIIVLFVCMLYLCYLLFCSFNVSTLNLYKIYYLYIVLDSSLQLVMIFIYTIYLSIYGWLIFADICMNYSVVYFVFYILLDEDIQYHKRPTVYYNKILTISDLFKENAWIWSICISRYQELEAPMSL